MEDHRALDVEALLVHDDWLRALARALIRESARSDDVAQEVWIEALERPPRSRENLRGWLGRVLRTAARTSRRREARRVELEGLVERSAEGEAAGATIERAELQRDVADAVLSLSEPYRTAILLRYFDDLPPREIANRIDVPVATVRTRLQRGREHLRARLDARRGGREAWLPALGGWIAGRGGGGLAAAALASGPTKAVLGVAAVGLALVAAREMLGSDAPLPPSAPPSSSGDVQLASAPPGARAEEIDAPAVAVAPERRAIVPSGPEERGDEAEPAPGPPPWELVVRLELPDGRPIDVAWARATFTDATGERIVLESRTRTNELVGQVPFGRYDLDVAVPEERHRRQVVELPDPQVRTIGDGRITERAYLWPEGWLPVVVRTPDGRPFTALAEELGEAPMRFFVDAFDVRASRGPVSAAVAADGGTAPARFHAPPVYQSVELSSGVAGSLRLLEDPPFEAGLWVYGDFVSATHVSPYDDEVTFVIDRRDLEERLATLRLRAVDRATGAPATEAVAGILADTSAYRRAGLGGVAPDSDGRIVFDRVVPNTYELKLQWGDALVQRRLTLGAGEDLDLGDLELGLGVEVLVRVSDANGEPVKGAAVQLAPYERGANVERLYHPNLNRWTGRAGEHVLPLPNRPSIVRAQVGGSTDGWFVVTTPNVLLDPDHPPTEIELASRFPVVVTLEPSSPRRDGTRFTVEDELELVVGSVEGPDDLDVRLVPGRYTVRRWEGDLEVGRTPLHVPPGDPLTLRID